MERQELPLPTILCYDVSTTKQKRQDGADMTITVPVEVSNIEIKNFGEAEKEI